MHVGCLAVRLAPILALATLVGCSDSIGTSDARDSSADALVDGTFDATIDSSGLDALVDAADAAGDGAPCTTMCGTICCARGQRCTHGSCAPNLGTCRTNDDCPGDSYCDTDGTCVPYGIPPTRTNDPDCRRRVMLEGVTPAVQCEWAGGDTGPNANLVEIYTTPVVAELNLDRNADTVHPSIVVTTYASTVPLRGVVRVFDGRTCVEQMRIGGEDDPERALNEPGYASQFAIGDLDGDVVTMPGGTVTGHPEIVTYHRTAPDMTTALQLIAFRIVDGTPPRLARMWTGRRCDLAGEPAFSFASGLTNAGPSLADLDDDGRPEVIVDRYVFDSRGCVLNPTEPYSDYLRLGLFPVIADVDHDGLPELVRADGVYAWNTVTHRWTLEPYWAPAAGATVEGHVAVADFGNYSTLPGRPGGERLPEIVVVSANGGDGTVRIMTVTGTIVFGPVPVYAAGTPTGRGGPPTVADFDGDGLPEFSAAARDRYTVYDPDCTTVPRPGGRCVRAAGLPTGVLWAQPSQDFSREPAEAAETVSAE